MERSSLSLELYSGAALLDCCFEDESTSFTSGSDGSIQRFAIFLTNIFRILIWDAFVLYEDSKFITFFMKISVFYRIRTDISS